MGAGIVGAIAPKTPLRYVAILIWLYSAWRGIQLAYEHTMIQLHPSPFMTCDFAARFLRGCHWISGFRRSSLLLRAIVLKNSGSSCRWKCRNGC
jgi:disulfide bond formation protein DsbB